MTESTSNKSRRRGWCCGCAIAIVVLAMSAVIGLAIFYLINLRSGDARVQAELARLRAAGEPVTPSECETKIAPGEKNAADLYAVAFNRAPKSLGFDESEKRSKQPPNVQVAWEQDLVEYNQRYLSLLDEASRIPKCRFPHDWSEGPNTKVPEFSHLREATKALKAKAEVARRAGNVDAAVGASATILRLANHAQQFPGALGHSVSCSLQGYATRELAAILSSGDPSPAGLPCPL